MAADFPKTINAMCPKCERAIPIPFERIVTHFHQRTCRGCRTVWWLKVKPTEIFKGHGVAHVIDIRPRSLSGTLS